MSLENWETSGSNLTTNYYLVVINPELHRQVWNSLKLTMAIAEAAYVLFYDNTIKTIHMEEITYENYLGMNYSLN
jgi:hypothetical protein